MTVLQLITSALRMIGQLGPGRTPGTSETADALLILNRMLDQWNAEKLLPYATTRYTGTLVADTQDYTIGASGDFNTTRPAKIESFTITDNTVATEPIEYGPYIPLTPEQWANIADKSATSELPTAMYDDGGYPLRTLYFHPIPSGSIAAVILQCSTQFSAFANTGVTVEFPPGYEDAITYNLAKKLSVEWQRPCPALVAQEADRTKAVIKAANMKPMFWSSDAANVNGSDYSSAGYDIELD